MLHDWLFIFFLFIHSEAHCLSEYAPLQHLPYSDGNAALLYFSLLLGRLVRLSAAILLLIAWVYTSSKLRDLGFEFSPKQYRLAKEKAQSSYVPKTFKNHLKKTDVCSVCIAGNKAKLDLEQAKNPNNLDVFTIVRLQKLVGDFEAHRELEKMQKNAFKDHKQQLDKESCNLIADFKENFRIGGGPVESGNNFYQKNGELQKIHLWSDSGAHFKNSDYIYAIFKELQSIYMGKMFSLNFFLENHGKSDVDGHFGVLSRWFRDAEKKQDILSIEDLVTCFEQKSSQNRSTRGLDANDEAYKFYIYSKDMPRVDRHQIKIDGGIKLNLSYYFVNEKLFASPICSEDLSLYNP
ncbi:hypothetical protein BB560_003862, partial [Smittium megazygosporum]